MIKVKFEGRDEPVDLLDEEGMAEACAGLADADMLRISPDQHTAVLKTVLAGLHYWHVKNGAMLHIAQHMGSAGVHLDELVPAHNWLGSHLLNKEPIPWPPEELEEPQLNAALEGDDSDATVAE